MTISSSRLWRNVPPPPGSASAKASLYARFIPREELSSFAAWNPGNLGEAAASNAPLRPSAAAGPETAAADAAEDTAAQVRGARQSGYQDGYRDGLVALEGFKQSFASQATQQIGALLQSTGEQLDALQQEMARTLAVTATQLARQIVRGEISAQPQRVAAVAQEALDAMLLSARHITLRVHPEDHAFVAQGAADVLAARGARLLGDAAIARGGCLVESDIGLIDATIEARWRRAAASLGCEEAWDASAAVSPQVEPDAAA